MSKKVSFLQHLAYVSLRIFTFPLSLMPYSWIHALGKLLGYFAYYIVPKKLRKITYNNLALAQSLNLSEKEILKISRQSFQNLVINGLLYFRLKRSRGKIDRFVKGHNLKPLLDLQDSKQGVIAVTGHISNWELCFLHHTQFRDAHAVGKPTKNKRLYNYIKSIREMHKGRTIDMADAISEGLKVLKEGSVFSMVNDQSFTSSSYSYPFFGKRAWTSPSPALLSYRSKCPIVVITTVRKSRGRYDYFVSDPIWPNRSTPIKKEVPRLMDMIMSSFEKHIAKYPDQWLWQHKRWKQEGFHRVYAEYKADSILFILPKDPKLFKQINQGLHILKQIYRRSFLTFMVPKEHKEIFALKEYEVITYSEEKEICRKDYRFQLVFDFQNYPAAHKHFLSLGATRSFNLKDLLERVGAKESESFEMRDIFIRSLCLPDTPFY